MAKTRASTCPGTSENSCYKNQNFYAMKAKKNSRPPMFPSPPFTASATRYRRANAGTAERLLAALAGSDLHLLGGYIPAMRAGDIIGHEFMGEIIEVGPEVKKLRKGDRVVVCSILGCGGCEFCQRGEWSLCDNSNAEPEWTEKAYGYPTAGIFGYSHAMGGYAGSHAEFTRIPFAETTCFKVPDGVANESALFTSDAFPTGYMAADFAGIEPGDTVAVWGCGGVGLMAMHSAWLLAPEG
jgi:threonine dehydrogenase-like Zn-dependent dehydrogenase